MTILENTSLWLTVKTSAPVARSSDNAPICLHEKTTEYSINDYTNGPGWMSDVYEGTVCVDCGTILKRKKVY